MSEAARKLNLLRGILTQMGSLVIAYSGGVDSGFLLKVAHDRLGERAVAVTAVSESYPQGELPEAKRVAEAIGARHYLIETQEIHDTSYLANTPERCYHCKRDLYTRLKDFAREHGFSHVVDGTNYDDLGDHRPGRRVALEQGIRSPLQEAKLTKAEIRALSKEMGLPTWNKPSLACLASRVPYGTPITPQILSQIDKAETYLRSLGVSQLRVRHHGDIARIEVEAQDLPLLLDHRDQIVEHLRKLGYTYISLDLAGYRTGSMNEVIGSR